MDQSRTAIITGEEGVQKLHNATVAIFGVGGVGGYALEAIARSGVGTIHIFDYDTVTPSNINRQIIAMESSMGRTKCSVARERMLDINPRLSLFTHETRLTPENMEELVAGRFPFAIDAIDDVPAKIALLETLLHDGSRFISSMGAGNRLDPARIRVTDIGKTSNCPLARSIRKKLRERGITEGIRCIYSDETPVKHDTRSTDTTVGSISYLPGLFGLTAAGVIINDILKG
ncbi:MAG: tRNA cyclic N6-threonylcarbamoyladenosine(37) synthase TcdA [Spirochaetae bacterium HGW-Spirochaetae-1]|jgi:tRNA A37 threonylcarbamoyladenosine dehydratase|nr:MAG: tRNA cyclic N6-threonylcarbamoyladenosine(37) synthase TcdA [Spirochaetae bacterium HGW-Spirochaetae-1]